MGAKLALLGLGAHRSELDLGASTKSNILALAVLDSRSTLGAI